MNNKLYKLGMRAVHQKDIKTAIIEAKKNGFDVLEIHLTSPQFLPQNYTNEQLSDLKALAIKNNIILQTHSEIGQSMLLADNTLRDAEKKKLKKMIDFSRKLGAVSLTLHPGKAPSYYSGPGKSTNNDNVYVKYYNMLFEDSIKHIVSIAPKDLFICIENTDNFKTDYQKILSAYLKTGKVFLTWDIMKSYSSFQPEKKLHEDRMMFLKKNIQYVRNFHISGPSHGGLEGHEDAFITFFEMFKDKNVPMIIEILSLEEVTRAKKIIRGLGF
jgi:sugar phosphate isomerase/epimerase